MGKGLMALGIIVLVILSIGGWFFGTYNSLVGADINVDEKWAQIQNQYQRRFELVGQLVNSTKMYINYEKELMTTITEARSKWGEALSQPIETQMETAQNIQSNIDRLLAVVSVENYPELKADAVVMTLMDELAGTANRVTTEIMRYNEAVASYNKKLRMFPSNIIAGMYGFEKRPMFEADIGAQTAPRVPI